MKFSEINGEQWQDLKPYLDTCLLPVTGIAADEEPWEIAKALEKLGKRLELLEIPFKGRIVTYPSVHYITESFSEKMGFAAYIDSVCANIRRNGFAYIIVMTGGQDYGLHSCRNADLLLGADIAGPDAGAKAAELITAMWSSPKRTE